MTTLGELWRVAFPAARSHATTAALDRPVAWVRVLKSRVPAFDALEPGDLAILPGTTLESLAGTAVEPDGVVDAVARAGGSGVLVVGAAGAAATTLEAVTVRAGELDLGCFVLSEGDATGLERSSIAYILNGQAELDRRAADLEDQLENAALAGGGPDALAATIARFLGRPVAIEGRDGSVVAIHAPVGREPDAPAVADYLKRRRGAALRVPLPAGDRASSGDARRSGRGRRDAAGALLLLGEGPPSELERLATRRVATLLALELSRSPAVGAASTDGAAETLPGDGPPWVVIVARQIHDGAATATLEERQSARGALLALEPRRRIVLRGDADSLEIRLVAAAAADDAKGVAIARRVSLVLGRPVALSRQFSDAQARAIAEAQARATLEAVEALPDGERRQLSRSDGSLVAPSELLPALRLVAGLPALPDGARHARALLEPVLGANPARNRETIATMRAVLDHPGLAEAAAALGVHRNTITYRLRRIEERSGWALSDPLLRFSLGMALRIVQSTQGRATPDDAVPVQPTDRGR